MIILFEGVQQEPWQFIQNAVFNDIFDVDRRWLYSKEHNIVIVTVIKQLGSHKLSFNTELDVDIDLVLT